MSDETPQVYDLSAPPRDDAPTVGVNVSSTAIHLPNDVDSPDWADVYTKLGRPATPAGYTHSTPEGFEFDQKPIDDLREVAHAQGLSVKQFDALLTSYLGKQAEAYAELEKSDQEEALNTELERRAKLTKVLGADPDTVLGNAGKAFRAIGIPELGEAFRTNPNLHQAEIYQLLAGIGKLFEQSTIPGNVSQPLSDSMRQTLQRQFTDAEAAYKSKPTAATTLAYTTAKLNMKSHK